MRLRKVKLAGFKSFVDPTTFIVPDSLVGIVGPNGCGKSNIIDAVTWVMGESSAKHLRGDALTDVIFNGSSARQPTGQAAVEIIFDNADGKLGGQYASYHEIAIKRQINREAISTYFLNGTRCRRKDIQSIFLGTGLGSRSYAIIEQGMISRLIEARPEELRTFIEEAAGISKFRERRRETENRIRHTRENTARLNDIREELEKQLNHLQRQARAAERYQVLKQQERQLKAELLALNWQVLTAEVKGKSEQVTHHETRVEQGMARLREIENGIEQQRQLYAAANAGFNQTQSDFYQLGADISHLEQRIEHTHEKLTTLTHDLETARQAEQEMQQQRQQDRQALQSIQQQYQQLQPQLHGSRRQSDAAYTTLTTAEGAMQAWQSEWDTMNETLAEHTREFEVTHTRIDYLQDDLQEVKQRRLHLASEAEAQDLAALEAELEQLADEHTVLEKAIRQQRQQQLQAQDMRTQLREQLLPLNSQLLKLRNEQQANEAKVAALEARQRGDWLDHKTAIDRWLNDNGLLTADRVIDQVVVEEDWCLAFEMVAGHLLQDIIVDDLQPINARSAELTAGRIGLLRASTDSSAYKAHALPRLQEKITTRLTTLMRLLERIYIADDRPQAEQILPQLAADESVVTQQGIWLNRHWTRINRPAADAPGMLSREQQLNTLQRHQKTRQQQIAQLERQLAETDSGIDAQEQRLAALQEQQAVQQDRVASAKARHAECSARYQQSRSRLAQITDELAGLDLQEESDNDELTRMQGRLQQIDTERRTLLTQKHHLEEVRAAHQAALEKARNQWQNTHQHSHDIALQLQSCNSQKASIEQAIKRNDIQIASTHQRIQAVTSSIAAEQQPLKALQADLAAKLAEKRQAETRLAAAREHVQTREQGLRQAEQQRGDAEQAVQEVRAELEQSRLAQQEIKVRLQTVAEQLRALQREPLALIEQLEAGASEPIWQERLASTERKIQRLGAINLAAIDEYEHVSERKTYLNSQRDDLDQALATLEAAIRKIDKETRTRFRNTFDRLNQHLKTLFPILFGGGHACLEMTGQDLLETGVTVMARPPGKKNSTIHLLSGGEKALTAVALVFSIFKLNPAPFCILDEVDAPLDDANVVRFSELVRQMAEEVQFIVITHNKITMEMTQQLLGVTMQEPGVSRLVSVDMEEAARMAATA